MLDLAVVSGMLWAVPAAPADAAMMTLPVRGSRDGGWPGRLLPAALPEDRPPFAVTSVGVP